MNRQAVLDVLNSLEVVDEQGGEDAYILVDNNQENRDKLAAVGITEDMFRNYGDDDTFCILAFAFGENFADDYDNGKLIIWTELVNDELRYRVLGGEGTATDAERLLRALEPELFTA